MILSMVLFVSIVPKDIKENLISLRDYEFVGEDKKLKSLLSERMPVLDSNAKLPDLPVGPNYKKKYPGRNTSSEDHPPFNFQPDILESNVSDARVNVTLDYDDYYNFTDEFNYADMPGPWLLPEDRNYTYSGVTDSLDNLTSIVAGNLSGIPIGGRRQVYWDPTKNVTNYKVLEIMKQNIYLVQGRLLDIDNVVKNNQDDVRFRIAFVFNRLDEWRKEIRTIYYAMMRYWYYRLRFKNQLFNYEHVLRKNHDITYTVEYLIYMHSEFMRKMYEVVPRSQIEEMDKMKKKREKLLTNKTREDFLNLVPSRPPHKG